MSEELQQQAAEAGAGLHEAGCVGGDCGTEPPGTYVQAIMDARQREQGHCPSCG